MSRSIGHKLKLGMFTIRAWPKSMGICIYLLFDLNSVGGVVIAGMWEAEYIKYSAEECLL